METHHVPGEEHESPRHHEKHESQNTFRKVYARVVNFSYLEIAGVVAIMILIMTSTFQFQLTVKRKPWANKLLGGKEQPAVVETVQTTQTQATAAPAAALLDPDLEAKVLPSDGITLPVKWGDLGKQLIKEGVIDQQKMDALYAQRGGMPDEMKKMLQDSDNGNIKFTPQNSSGLLNVFWAFGLGQKNEILDKGEIQDKQYGGAGNFAATGGWTLSRGQPMDHFSKHRFITLTADQQAVVDRVSRNIYRPCCGNSTHFPDCNHGMAMLGLLELMASQGVSEQDMYKYALTINSYWFPDTYLTIAKYKKAQGADWSQVSPQEVLGAGYSSAQGYQQIKAQVEPVAPKASGGCGV